MAEVPAAAAAAVSFSRILVTGGLGFIGSHLTESLAEAYPSAEIMVVDKHNYASSIRNLRAISHLERFSLECFDLSNLAEVNRTMRNFRPDVIFHLAAETHVDRSFGNSLEFTRSNVVGTHNLLEAARRVGTVSLFVHMSTDEVYGSGADAEVAHSPETSILIPTNPYSASKAAAEMQVVAYAHSFNLPSVIIRCNNVYGPRQFCEKVVPRFSLQSIHGKACTLHGSGLQMRSFLHVRDAVRAILLIAQNCDRGLGKSEIINIGSAHEISIRELASVIFEQEQQEVPLTHVPDRKFNDFRYPVHISRITELGWREEVELRKGLLETKVWYEQNAAEWFVPEDIARAIDSDGHFNFEFEEGEGEGEGDKPDYGKRVHVLLVGGTGWIGPKVAAVLADMGARVTNASFRLQDTRAMWEEIKAVKPTHVVLCAGITGRPNIDWCETHPQETVSINLEGTVTLAQICNRLGIHLTNYATGCIYTGGEDTPFTEAHKPNFIGSLYSRTKAHAETIQTGAYFQTTLVLRLRMPIGEDIDHPRNLVAKLRNYTRLINLPNSVSVLSELLPISCHMTLNSHTGLYNFTNPGAITPAQIMRAFDETFPHLAKPWTAVDDTEILFSTKAIVAPRSNCVLSAWELMDYADCYNLTPPHTATEAVRLLFKRCADSKMLLG
jgi:UDP-glucose 4,6-dehydratase